MDQEKIGKLIARQRKMKGLTQSELGDKVGVGYRSVSKWERGINLPDISIINKLSEILGISSDELLKGEVTNKDTTPSKRTNKVILSLILITVIFFITCIILNIYKNKTYIYKLETVDKAYYVDGEVKFKNKHISIYINNIKLNNNEVNEMIIKNYQYDITSNNRVIVGYSYLPTSTELVMNETIKEFINDFTINYIGELPANRANIINNNIVLTLTFMDKDNQELTKSIELKLLKEK